MGTRRAAAVLTVLAVMWTGHVNAADISNTASNRWVTDGRVTGVIAQGDLVYLAGPFSRVGPRTGPLAWLDPATGDPQPGPVVAGGDIEVMVPDGLGGYVIGGTFDTIGELPRKAIARLSTSGVVDPVFVSTAFERVIAIAVIGARVFASGDGPNGFSGILGLDRATGATLPWAPPRASAPGRLFALPTGTLVASYTGAAQSIPYPPVPSYEYDPLTGAELAFWPVMPLVTVDADTVIGTVRYSIQRVDVHTRAAAVLTTGTQPPGCNVGGPACAYITSMAVRSNVLYVTGDFTAMGGTPRAGVAAVDTFTGLVLPWQPPAIPNVPLVSIHAATHHLLVQYAEEGRVTALVACDPVSGVPTGWRGWLLGGRATGVFGEPTRLVVAGTFRGAGGVPRRGLAAVRWPEGTPADWHPDVGMTPHSLVISGDRVFVAGGSWPSGAPAWIREVDRATGSVAAWAVAIDRVPAAMCAMGTRLFVAGDFNVVAGVTRRYLASLDVSGPVPVLEPWAPEVSSAFGNFGVIRTIDVFPQAVVIAGGLTSVGLQARAGAAAIDPRSGGPLPWTPQLEAAHPQVPVYFAEIAGDRAWVSGDLVGVAGQPRAGIAAFDLQGRLTAWLPERPDLGHDLNGFDQRAWYFEDRLYASAGYSVEASTGELTAWAPDLERLVAGGSWAGAPGFGLVRFDTYTGGFFLYPRTDLPGPVFGLTAAISANTVTLSWMAASGAVAYVIEAGSTSGAADLGRFEVDASNTILTVPAPDGRYIVRVRARSDAGLVSTSNELVLVIGPGACGAPPSPPTDLRADIAGTRVRLMWQLPATVVLGTSIEASLDGGGSYLEAARSPGATMQFDTQAPPGRYLARVRAANACGVSAPSPAIDIVITAVAGPPSPPANLQATVGQQRSVTLSWEPSTGLPADYVVQVGSAAGLSDLAMAAVSGTSVTVDSVPPCTYYVRVLARNEGGESAPSNEVVVTVP